MVLVHALKSSIFSQPLPESQRKTRMQENRYNGGHNCGGSGSGGGGGECYFVFMNYDPQYERLRADRSVKVLHNNRKSILREKKTCFFF